MDFQNQIEQMIHEIGVQGVMAVVVQCMTDNDIFEMTWDDAKEFAKGCLNDCVPEDAEPCEVAEEENEN